MTFSELFTILNSITGFDKKVAYRQWPEGQAPELPFIVYYAEGSDNVLADNKVYMPRTKVVIELYSVQKDTISEGLIESALNGNDIPWEKYEEYIESEHMLQISYEIII